MTEKRLKSALGRALAGLENRTETDATPGRVRAAKAQPGQAPATSTSTPPGRAQPIRYLDTMEQGIETQDIFEVDTERCVLWPYHNRLYDLLTEEDCADLIESIRTHGQLVPAIGRRRRSDDRVNIEIISGARRLWVARYLKLHIKVELRALNDEEAFVVSEDSNRYSDITHYERAIEYRRVLEAVFGRNQARMAARVNISEAQLSRYLALAELPQPVINAFSDPRKITLKLAAQIRAALKVPSAETRILAVASEIAKVHEPTDAQAVARRLLRTRSRKPDRGGERMMIKGGSGDVVFTVQKRTRDVIVTIPRDKIGQAGLAQLVSETLANISRGQDSSK